MMTSLIRKCGAAVFVATSVCAAYAQWIGTDISDIVNEIQLQNELQNIANMADVYANKYADSSSEKREQESAPDHIKEIFALAKKSAKEDGSINFCGFFVGMSVHDASALCEYYKEKRGISGALGVFVERAPGKAVFSFKFTLKAVRRITNGGNSFRELAQAVANRVGDLKGNYKTGKYEYKTIDGYILTMDEKDGLRIWNEDVRLQKPIRATAEAVQKDEADAETAQKKAAVALSSLIKDMITIPGKNFKMGKYEVTQAQWVAVMGYNPSYFKGDDKPVGRVSWDDCKKFLEKLNALPEVKTSGLTFRLPTVAEWEYACRAGGTGAYCRLADGTEITEDTLDKVAWRGDRAPHSVGQKEPNAFGLYDMNGNVSEWCEDMGQDKLRYIAGGSYDVIMECYRAGYHFGILPDHRSNSLGFRLAASQD